MTQLHPTIERGDAAVAGRLIKHRIALDRSGEGFGVALLFDLERIETGALHENELVAQHLPGPAQLAFIAVAFAQQARLAVRAAVAESRKYQRDCGEPVEI